MGKNFLSAGTDVKRNSVDRLSVGGYRSNSKEKRRASGA